MKIFLIRHGETTGDIENRYGGSYDDHLTEMGRASFAGLQKVLGIKALKLFFTVH